MRDAAVRVRGGILGGAGVVALLWAAQVRPSARPARCSPPPRT
ncbi:hypothetical protein ACFWBN_19635 [Streptomyces sp. NPDC059989]